MAPQRDGLRTWLEKQINSAKYKGLRWINHEEGMFEISWKHASGHTWKAEDAALFKNWAIYTGKYKEGGKAKPKMWKANFRCALNSLSDISCLKEAGEQKGKNATRIFQFSKVKRSKNRVTKRRVSLKLEDLEEEYQPSTLERVPNVSSKYNTRSKLKKSHQDHDIDIENDEIQESEIKMEIPNVEEDFKNSIETNPQTPNVDLFTQTRNMFNELNDYNFELYNETISDEELYEYLDCNLLPVENFFHLLASESKDNPSFFEQGLIPNFW